MLELWFAAYESGVGELTDELAEKLHVVEIAHLDELLQYVRYNPPRARQQQTLLAQSLVVLRRRLQKQRQIEAPHGLVAQIAETYRSLYGQWSGNYLLLAWLAEIGGQQGLEAFLKLWLDMPPGDSLQVALAFQPLLQPERRSDLARLFPDLLAGIGHLPSAAIILDAANYLYRQRLVDRHPAEPRRAELAELLGRLVQHLDYLDERQMENLTITQRRAMVVDCVSLAVGLCNALALIGDATYTGKLYQALQLRHRRVRAEAAYALAMLGEEHGREVLLEMAADPAVRLRVLAYAEELGVLDHVGDEFRTEQARAESELAIWLAEQSQMGMPPHDLELVAARRLYWPGYREPVNCYLFRFTYRLARGEYSNIGIVGPVTHAFAADLTDLPVEDVFAVYAGWHAEHDEIFETDVRHLTEPSRRDVHRLKQLLAQEGFEQIQPLRLGFFFGERALIARATRNAQSGVVVAGPQHVEWWPNDPKRRGFGPDEAFAIFKGRRLLGVFNQDLLGEPVGD